jgi:hypothetical protein
MRRRRFSRTLLEPILAPMTPVKVGKVYPVDHDVLYVVGRCMPTGVPLGGGRGTGPAALLAVAELGGLA